MQLAELLVLGGGRGAVEGDLPLLEMHAAFNRSLLLLYVRALAQVEKYKLESIFVLNMFDFLTFDVFEFLL